MDPGEPAASGITSGTPVPTLPSGAAGKTKEGESALVELAAVAASGITSGTPVPTLPSGAAVQRSSGVSVAAQLAGSARSQTNKPT